MHTQIFIRQNIKNSPNGMLANCTFSKLIYKEKYNKIIKRFTHGQGHAQKILNTLEKSAKKPLTETVQNTNIIPKISYDCKQNNKIPQYTKSRDDTEPLPQKMLDKLTQINEIKSSKKPAITPHHKENDTNIAEFSCTNLKKLSDDFLNPPLPSSGGLKSSVTLIPPLKYNDFPKRGYASVRAGTFDPTSDLVTNGTTDIGTPIQGDISGYHQNVVITSCAKPDCKTTNCADSTKIDPNPCGKNAAFHQGPLTPQQDIHNEFIGTLTHKTPKTMMGQIIDPFKDVNGFHSKGQSMAVEKNVSTVDISEFNQNAKTTTYLQENSHTKAVLTALPADSVLNN